ncbi:transposase [Jannaschia aquimarina]|uniref:Transposase DDE domain-containing protein n=1 Tax=Jannaschia aquimarina TaxID=935700 RepID=A0A0D1EFR6_9RHOB|nr:hypothetical protein jaqu_35720 [Jannaschia aquimarina]SNT39717.1 Transposase DDE domain-containing protein [Jannaschia aquimarina]
MKARLHRRLSEGDQVHQHLVINAKASEATRYSDAKPGQPRTPHPTLQNRRPYRTVAREIARTEAYVISMRLRKKLEILFARLKRMLGLGRLRLRGPCGAGDAFLLATIAQNLRKLAKTFPLPPKPVTP